MRISLQRVCKLLSCALMYAASVPAQAPSLSVQQKELARSVLKQLVETDTTHATGGTTVAATAIRDRLLSAGFATADLTIAGPREDRMNLVVRVHGTASRVDGPVLFIGHLDVVDAKRSDWTLDPFVLTEKSGFLYGRGTQDMKNSDAALVTSLLIMKEQNFAPRRDLIVAFTADEESGGDNGVDWLLRNRRDLIDAALVINPDAGGVVQRNGRPTELDLEATEKLYADFRLTVTSPGGHSSLPRADNPIYELAAALGRLEKAPFPLELNPVTRAYLQATMQVAASGRKALLQRVLATPMDMAAAAQLAAGDARMNALLRTTCVATLIAGGHAVNALPGSATANINCRILPGHSPAEVMSVLQTTISDPSMKLDYVDVGGVPRSVPTVGAMAPPPLSEAVMLSVGQCATAIFGPIPVLPVMETGASDSIYTLAVGIPSYGVNGMAIDEGDERAHGRDERIGITAYNDGVLFQLMLMKAIGEK